ncbi:MAG: BrnT family toxin [Nostoc sp.]|uniref:BrnT family toxin n=1 Tax=Nostoc sp. TaxID=1180 RepID=UPI002FFCED6F
MSLQSGKRSCIYVMEFEWDEAKRFTNLRKHGIDFIDIPAVFDGDTVTVEDDRYSYGEQRFVTFGLLQERVVAVVHTERDDLRRIISARKATKYEQRIYFEQL